MILLTSAVQPGVFLPCEVTQWIYNPMVVWLHISSAVFSTFRIWAIWGRHWIVLVVVLPIGLVPAANELFLYSGSQVDVLPGPSPLGGCGELLAVSIDTLIRLSIASRASSIAVDTIVLASTWAKTWSIYRGLKSSNIDTGQTNVSLSGLLIRDGTTYFAFVPTLFSWLQSIYTGYQRALIPKSPRFGIQYNASSILICF